MPVPIQEKKPDVLEDLVEELFDGAEDLLGGDDTCDEDWQIEDHQLDEDVELDEEVPIAIEKKKRVRKIKSLDFQCSICKRCFESDDQLDNHRCGGDSRNLEVGAFRCALCGQASDTSEKLAFHRSFHTAELMAMNLKCSECGDDSSKTIIEIYNHLNENHNIPFKCGEPGCNKEFQLRSSLRTHNRVHGKKNFQCLTCLKVFFDFQSLNEHAVTHLKSKPFQCHICFKYVNRRSRLRMHILAHEAQPRENAVIACKNCEMAFKCIADAEEHIRVSEECRNSVADREFSDIELIIDKESGKKSNFFEVDNTGEDCKDENLPKLEIKPDQSDPENAVEKLEMNGEDIETAEVLASHTLERMTVEQLESKITSLGQLFIKVVNIRMVYRCEYCEKVYAVRDALNAHRIIHDNVKNAYICNVCQAAFPTYSRCTSHKTSHGFYKSRKQEGELTEKMPEDIKGYDPFPVVKHFLCQICNKTFLHWTYLQMHKRSKHATSSFYSCKLCGEKFKESWRLTTHKKKMHPEILAPKKVSNNYKCVECEEGFNTRKQLIKHMEVNHSDSPLVSKSKPGPFECTLCDKVYVTKVGIDGHMRIHNGGTYLCSTCGNGFAHKTGLETHNKRVHLREQRHVCNVCNQTFFSMAELEGHRRCHTGEKPYRCNYCFQSFRTKGRRNEHHRVHTGERPYPCDICGLAFRRSHAMKNHRRIHTGEKNYRCPHCAKLFHVRSNLNTHIKHKHPGQFVVLEVEGGPEVRAALEESLQLLAANEKIKKEYKVVRRTITDNGIDDMEDPDAPNAIVEDIIVEGEDISNEDGEYIYSEPMYLTQNVKLEDDSNVVVANQGEIIVNECNEPIILQEGEDGVQIQYISTDDGTGAKLIEYAQFAVEHVPSDDQQIQYMVKYNDQVEELILEDTYEESTE